jgi:coenzyme F420-reducing hydrogenase gamma subunit
MVADGTPCMGPVTRAGCGALCPRFRRGCYGCFGPKESANTAALTDTWKRLGADAGQLLRAYRSFNAHARPFREEARNHDYPSRH